ncbi:tRNA uridine 5-carboxymethylaminomethyl modification enzyme MnmG [Clostridia bacterium]|nr:tRNA uridine 5-carboxymethylaminomethyl modification enzyme MnmG [Clostridia bacterium]
MFDVAIIGGGHAGIEAALASARLGAATALFTLSLDYLGNMPCNPSVGGTGKGHLVFEVDALGGEMGRAADDVMMQCRMLNSSKGPAVHSLRFQADRRRYQMRMKQTVENTCNLDVIQAEIVEIIFNGEDGAKSVAAVKTSLGEVYETKCAVIASGTYLMSRCIIGGTAVESGPDNSLRASKLSECLRENGVTLRRFKTGTPPRVHADSIDYSKLERQDGDEIITNFSRVSETKPRGFRQYSCWLAYTNETTHDIIRANLHRSAMYSGAITGTGARYCPSIEDKVVRFADKTRHQIFVEPMGIDTKEMYLQGLSTSMPIDVQKDIVHSMSGLECAKFMRPAYAIEYDCTDPSELTHSLEFRQIRGLFGAGQFNGTSGYEEAAAQGIIAGINAAHRSLGRPPFTLGRDEAYIGMLIDDLVTKGTNEPYRVMTSRTEYRLSLRQDNADERLTPKAHAIGLVGDDRMVKLQAKLESVRAEIERAKNTTIYPNADVKLNEPTRLYELLKHPEMNYNTLVSADTTRPRELTDEIMNLAYVKIRYEGYIKREESKVRQYKKLEGKTIPADIDYASITGLRLEARQKLSKHRPQNIGEAAAISGVSPADVAALIIWLER